jgi:uncharacterized protein
MSAQMGLQAIDMHSHWSTRRGYPLQTEAELAQQERTWRSKPEYRSEAEMAEDFRRAEVRVILDFGYTKYLPVDQAREIHDYGFATQQANPDVIIGNWVHFQPELGAAALAEFRRCLDRGAGFVGLAVSGSGGLPASHPAWEPFYRLCIEAKAPALIFVGTTGLGAGLPGGNGITLDSYLGAAGLAVAKRDDRGAAAQAQCLVRIARLVAEIFHRRIEARDPAAPCRAGDVRGRLSAVSL